MNMLPIVLASTSPYRAALLQQLQVPFETCAPDIDETPLPYETPETMIQRLTQQKAIAVAPHFAAHFIIASDQCAVFNNRIIGKPHTHERAVKQLQDFSGQSVTFLTGLILMNTQTGRSYQVVEPFRVHFRTLSDSQIEHYLQQEQPYYCAGSFKVEGLGITLFKRLEGDDPNSLIGLPLIKLTSFLAEEGITLPFATETV